MLEGIAKGHKEGEWELFCQQVDKALPKHVRMPLFEEGEGEQGALVPAG